MDYLFTGIGTLAKQVGIKDLPTVVMLCLFCYLIIRLTSNNRVSKKFEDIIEAETIKHNEELRSLNSNLEKITNSLQEWNVNVIAEIDCLRQKVEYYETVIKKNTLQYIRLAFEAIQINQKCKDNVKHVPVNCPYTSNVMCETLEMVKTRIMRELDLIVLGNDKVKRIRNLLETYVIPDTDINTYLETMLQEIQQIIEDKQPLRGGRNAE